LTPHSPTTLGLVKFHNLGTVTVLPERPITTSKCYNNCCNVWCIV